jgi:hypothetical protein
MSHPQNILNIHPISKNAEKNWSRPIATCSPTYFFFFCIAQATRVPIPGRKMFRMRHTMCHGSSTLDTLLSTFLYFYSVCVIVSESHFSYTATYISCLCYVLLVHCPMSLFEFVYYLVPVGRLTGSGCGIV